MKNKWRTKSIEFVDNGSVAKVAKAYVKLNDFSRKGILKAFVDGTISNLNIVELCAIYDDIHVGRADFIPEFFPRYSGHVGLDKSKEYWGEYWHVIFGEDGEHWGKTLHDATDVSFWKLRDKIEELQKKEEENKG